jgi:iron complex transport system substrate-binding protein
MTSHSVRGFAAATLLLLSACGSSKTTAKSVDTTVGKAAAPAASAFPVTVAGVTITAEPKAIVSLSPTATEMLFAVGAGKQVIAVDDQSNYPAEAPKTDLSGFKPNIEAIAAKKPDLVVIADDSAKLSEALGKLGIATLVMPPAAQLSDAYAQIEQLGVATGHTADGVKVSATMKDRIDKAIATAPKAAKKLTYYHELDDTFFSVTSKTFIGQIYSQMGLENIADSADKDGFGYPQLSAEAIVAANPDLIFLADTKCCGQTAEKVAARPGFAGLKAVTSKGVVALDDDIASRWGPRLADQVEAIAAKLATLQPA